MNEGWDVRADPQEFYHTLRSVSTHLKKDNVTASWTSRLLREHGVMNNELMPP